MTAHRLFIPLVAVVLVLAGCSDDGSDGASDPTSTTAAGSTGTGGDGDEGCDGSVDSPDPRFIVDDCGRVVILRGVNVESSAKGGTQDENHLPKSAMEDQTALGQWGWNSVRFLVFWGAIEPEPGTYDEAYLDEVETWLDWYAEHDVHVVLDMHQDLYAWKVNGDGAPDWAVETGGLEVQDIPEGQPWYLQGADPAVQAAYQSFWNPADGDTRLQDHYLGALTHLTERFADHPAVLGVDIMNEPVFANGDLTATLGIQEQAAAGEFHNENLTSFTTRAIEAVRAASDDTYVFFEPTSLINYFPYAGDLIEADITDPRDGEPRLVYAGHLYEPSVHDGHGYLETSTYVEEWEGHRVPEAEELEAALWFGEWGGAPDQDRMDEFVAEVLDMSDRNMAGWSWWSWDPGGWSPVEGDGTTMSANGTRLLRVQPRAVAGTPTGFEWDADASVFRMQWDERAAAVGDTELSVPAALFPDGVEIVLDGEPVADPAWDRDTGVLRLTADRDADGHELCLAAAGSNGCD